MTTLIQPAKASGEFSIGGELPVTRLGFGAMRLTGPGIWGDPEDPDEAVRVLHRVVELGVNFIDTADSYGPAVAEPLIKKALHPYPADLVIATKVGQTRQGPGRWTPQGRPDYLRQQVELSLRFLGLEQIPLMQLHRVDPMFPLADQVGELASMRDEGKIRFIGLSEVTVDQLRAAQAITPIATVQNLYSLTNRNAERLLDYSAANGIGFIPWNPLAIGELARPTSPIAALATKLGASPSQLALAWLLRRSPAMLPIPGTSSVAHLEENVAAAGVTLSEDDYADLEAAVR
jgi:aryl-alcohol dehydrogenase-like predicted oxidoreductase